MKLWGGRFETGPSEIFERFSGSLAFDRRLMGADIRGSQAFARALEQAGILTAGERALIIEALDQIQEEAAEPEFFANATDEDVHTLVIRKLKERAGAVADKIHTGRSRNEQVSLDLRLWLRAECDRVRALLAGAMQALLDLAARYRAGGALAALPAGLFRNVRARRRALRRGPPARERHAAGLRRAGRQRFPLRSPGHGPRPGLRYAHRQ
jgi:argininosuccinate lyase